VGGGPFFRAGPPLLCFIGFNELAKPQL